MTLYVAPAKLNLSLLVGARRADGYHPIRSLIQTIEWCDTLDVEPGEADRLEVSGVSVPAGDENLVMEAIAAIRSRTPVPYLSVKLDKVIPVAAGLGGGSADAAAALLAAAEEGGLPAGTAETVAAEIGSDLPAILMGGTVLASGRGEVVERRPNLDGFSVAVVVPRLELSTSEVYSRWDDMGRPEGAQVPARNLPPVLRGETIRNDLTPAAVSLAPKLGDFMADVAREWGTAVLVTGSGPACFGCFPGPTEAAEAARAVSGWCRASVGVELRRVGAARAGR